MVIVGVNFIPLKQFLYCRFSCRGVAWAYVGRPFSFAGVLFDNFRYFWLTFGYHLDHQPRLLRLVQISPNRACSMGFWRSLNAAECLLAALAFYVHENNEIRTGILDIFLFVLSTPFLWRSPAHARCSHSNIFQPNVYRTNAKIIICLLTLIFRIENNVFS